MKKPRKARVNWTKEKIKSLIEEWDNVESASVLANDFNMSLTTINRMKVALSKLGFKFTPKYKGRSYYQSLIKEMYDDGDFE